MVESVLCFTDSKTIKAGSICIFNQNKLFLIDNEIPSQEVLFTPNSLGILTNEEYNILKSVEPHKRVKKLQHYQNCQNLKPNDKILIVNSNLEWTVTNKNLVEEKIIYSILASNKETKEIETTVIKRIISNQNPKSLNSTLERSNTISKRKKEEQLKLINEIYLSNSSNLKQCSNISTEHLYSNNQLVQVLNIEVYGRIKFVISNSQTVFACISINDGIHKELGDIINQIEFRTNIGSEYFQGIIVLFDCVKEFSESLIYANDCPNLCKSSFKFVEENDKSKFNSNDLVKFYGNKKRHYANVVKICLINNEPCLQVSWIFPEEAQKSELQFVKECDMVKVDDQELEFKYFEGVIMTPYPILTIETTNSKHININDKVYFILRDSLKKIKGRIIWIGKLNGIFVGILNLKKDYEVKIGGKFRIKEHRMKYFKEFQYNDLLYIVPLCHLKREKYKELQEIIIEFLRPHDDCMNVVINKAMAMREKSILPLLIKNMEVTVELELYQELLLLLFERKQYETMELLLNKSISNERCDLLLLDLGLKCLKLDNIPMFEQLVQKCINKNIKFDNGETFMTNIFKENMSHDIIIYLLDKNFFDLNQSNNDNETPLILACENLLIDVVEKIMSASNLNTPQVAFAQWKVLGKNKIDNSIEEKDKIINIVKILSSKTFNDNFITSICSNCKEQTTTEVGFESTICKNCLNDKSQSEMISS